MYVTNTPVLMPFSQHINTVWPAEVQQKSCTTPHLQYTSMYGNHDRNLTDLSSDFLSLMMKRKGKWTNEKPQCGDDTDWSASVWSRVCITVCAHSVFFHQVFFVVDLDVGTGEICLLHSVLCSWSPSITAGSWTFLCLGAVLNMKENREETSCWPWG